MKYTEEEMLQDVANGVLQDMETMFELANGEPKVRKELPSGWVKKQVSNA